MSTRVRFSIIKGVTASSAANLIAAGLERLPGPVPSYSRWADRTYKIRHRELLGLICDGGLVLMDDAWLLAKEIGLLSGLPYLELRVQEGDHWDFTLFRGERVIADFSTRVAYFDPDRPRPWKQGDAEAFAKGWDIPRERVAPYLIDWSAVPAPYCAADGDEYPVGDWQQITDFMRVLEVEHPYLNPNHFRIDLPEWKDVYARQWFWWRAIRQISAWIKGTYPDVPRRSEEFKEELRRRRSSIVIVRSELKEKRPSDGE